MAKLTDDQITIAKAWLHDIFVAGGIYAIPKRTISIDQYGNMYGTHYYNTNRRPQIIAQAKELCSLIKLRKATTENFINGDRILEFFSDQWFLKSLAEISEGTKKPAGMLARYISWFCSTYEFYWDDSVTSTYEKEEILKTTLGKTLYADKCFVSQHQQKAVAKSTSSPRAASTGIPGQPQNPFKARGALSGVAVDLLSTPGQKEHLSLPIFSINGADSNGKVLEDTMYIRPVEADPKSQAKYVVNNTNKVLFGKAKGYGYCQVYFTDYNEAERFMKNATASGIKIPANVSIVQVCQLKNSLANGYFKIGTEFGPVYISASKLNECLQEEIQETTQEVSNENLKSKLSNKEKWEHFENSFYRE